MKNRMELTAVSISALLLLAVVGQLFSVKANFVFPPSNPAIIIDSPANRTYSNNTVFLEVAFRTYKTGYDGGPSYNTSRLFTYVLDGKNPEPITITNASVARNPGGDVFFEGLKRLPELTEGLHNLTVRAVFDYPPPGWDEPYSFHTESESTVYFRIDTVPQNISILMTNESTYTLWVPLQFFINEPASWIGYSLDGQENVTATGNMTLPAPSVGQHTLTLYAKDAAGNPSASETIIFSVADPIPPVLIIVISVATVGFLLVYFKKRSKVKEDNHE